jgi:cytochrome P450
MQKFLRDTRVSRWQAAAAELGIDQVDDPELREALVANNSMAGNYDEPDHTRLRRLMRLAFLPGAIEAWRPRTESVALGLIERVKDQREFEFVRALAFPLPEVVMCELLGVPHEDHALWSQWSHDAVANNRASAEPGESMGIAQQALLNFHRYMKDLVRKRRANLGDDLASVLIRAEDSGDKLTEQEVIGQLVALVQAGHETTANLITNGMYLLLQDRALYAELSKNPDRTPQAVEEFLRIEGPAPFTLPRVTLEDIEYRGTTIPAGSRVLPVLQAANRDPAVFENPDNVKIDRPNCFQHVSFGVGIHLCIGRELALMEAETMFREIVTRLPDLELVGDGERVRSYTRGWAKLTVRRASLA